MSREVEQRLRDASLAVLEKHGMKGLTVERIAEAAGVPRSTFYRRWSTASEAVAAAVHAAMTAANPKAPATGDVRQDLMTVGRNWRQLAGRPQFPHAFIFLIAEMEFNPSFRPTAIEIVRQRRRPTIAVLARAKEGGQLPSSADVDILFDAFAGAMVYRTLLAKAPLDEAYLARLVDLIAGYGGDAPRKRRRK